MATTQVTNVNTPEKQIFVNDLSLSENIISAIILSKKQTGRLLDKDYRQAIAKDYNVRDNVSGISKMPFACTNSETIHLYAKHI